MPVPNVKAQALAFATPKTYFGLAIPANNCLDEAAERARRLTSELDGLAGRIGSRTPSRATLTKLSALARRAGAAGEAVFDAIATGLLLEDHEQDGALGAAADQLRALRDALRSLTEDVPQIDAGAAIRCLTEVSDFIAGALAAKLRQYIRALDAGKGASSVADLCTIVGDAVARASDLRPRIPHCLTAMLAADRGASLYLVEFTAKDAALTLAPYVDRDAAERMARMQREPVVEYTPAEVRRAAAARVASLCL